MAINRNRLEGPMTSILPHAQLGQMITGYGISQAIYAAAKFGIADLLSDGPKSVDELATATGAKPGLLYRLLRALVSVGGFPEDDKNRFILTPLAEPLCSDVQRLRRIPVGSAPTLPNDQRQFSGLMVGRACVSFQLL
jgi:Dimerisation domain